MSNMEPSASKAIDPDRGYSPAEAAPLVGLNRKSLYALLSADAIRHRRLGPREGRIVILGRWLLEYLATSERGPDRRPPRKASASKSKTESSRGPARPAGPDWRSELEAARAS